MSILNFRATLQSRKFKTRSLNHEDIYNERELLVLIADGNESAFRQLFDVYRQKIYALGLHLTHADFLAEEIVQDVFLRIWVSREKLRDVIHFHAYLKVITRNVAFDYLRTIATEKLASRDMLAQMDQHVPSVEHQAAAREYEQMYLQAIETLSPQRRKTYLLSRQLGLKNEEIAQQMQISIHTVKENLKLASRQIRTQMTERMNMVVLLAVSLFLD